MLYQVSLCSSKQVNLLVEFAECMIKDLKDEVSIVQSFLPWSFQGNPGDCLINIFY